MDQPVFLLLASKPIYISSIQRVQYEYRLPLKSMRAEAERIVEILYKRRRILGLRKIGSGRIELFYEVLQHMFRAIRFFHGIAQQLPLQLARRDKIRTGDHYYRQAAAAIIEKIQKMIDPLRDEHNRVGAQCKLTAYALKLRMPEK